MVIERIFEKKSVGESVTVFASYQSYIGQLLYDRVFV